MTEEAARNWRRFDELFVDEHPMLGDIKDWMLPPFSPSDLRKQDNARREHETKLAMDMANSPEWRRTGRDMSDIEGLIAMALHKKICRRCNKPMHVLTAPRDKDLHEKYGRICRHCLTLVEQNDLNTEIIRRDREVLKKVSAPGWSPNALVSTIKAR